ncbi:hypothetical protein [Vibrio toranzoniae]|uniref:hypothetical protein n=1 Tax=Vibrio toranzoniae TaxID=1194427 RepID=UPI001378F76A|nr:hypothetical protein [Vibrio toranzoniae]NAZ95988.1 hypothetical protein [Vibrio toranzoniae]
MAIGGYNQIRLRRIENNLVPKYNTFQSARSALFSYLKSAKIKKIYLPSYICDSIIPCIQELDINIIWYEINNKLLPTNIPKLSPSECFLIINYFGINFHRICELHFEQADQIIIDNSQALFSAHIPGTTSIYSPRKFLGIPDGGWLLTDIRIETPDKTWNSEDNISHLLLRDAGEIAEGYKKFIEAENVLDDFIPHKMSKLTKHLIQCIDLSEIEIKRRENYQYLYEKLNHINEFDFKIENNIPLCFPLHFNENISKIHKLLVSNDIFTPRYWPSQYNTDFSNKIYNNTLFLPIDERITCEKLDYICNLIIGCKQ